MTSHAEKELKLVEEKIEKFEAKRDLLLDKESKKPSEIKFLEDFDEYLKQLRAKENYWQGIIEKSN